MSGTIYEAAMQQMWDIMWMRKNNWPSVQACTDSELRLLWTETEERYNMYCRIADQAEQRRNPPVALVVTEAEPTEEERAARAAAKPGRLQASRPETLRLETSSP